MTDQLDLLFKYQTFHIGIYVTLGTGIIGAIVLKKQEFDKTGVNPLPLSLAIISLLIAGMCGGFVVAKIPDFSEYAKFMESNVDFSIEGLFKINLGKPRFWESLEHLFFWISMVLMAIYGIFVISSPRLSSNDRSDSATSGPTNIIEIPSNDASQDG